jgi:hypothetical protein
MAGLTVDTTEIRNNPLDVLEELVDANEWRFDRNSAEEMTVELRGRWSDYRLFFIWQEDLSAICFSCVIDMRVPGHRRTTFLELLGGVNEKLWLGHFDLSLEEPQPMFRHTVLLRGAGGVAAEQLEDLVDIAVAECERFYPAFQLLLWGGKSPDEAVAAAMLETVGEA